MLFLVYIVLSLKHMIHYVHMRNLIILLIIIVIAVAGFVGYQTWFPGDTVQSPDETDVTTDTEQVTETGTTTDSRDSAEGTDSRRDAVSVIGSSVEGRDIAVHRYGNGAKDVLFVGGVHGGYEWNTVLVARELMSYLEDNQDAVPSDITVNIIPVLNPDGLHETVGTAGLFSSADVPESTDKQIAGRFNANGVDLNRNFACDWQEEGTWQDRTVDAGEEPFSEPESAAFQNYINQNNPDAVVVWFSAAGGVFASNCHEGVLPTTKKLTNAYADASGYPAYETFDFYEITGDVVNWLAREKIPAISVLLSNHTDVEGDENIAGAQAVIETMSDE